MRIDALFGRRFQVDFVQPRARVAPLGWSLLAIGTLALAAALADCVPQWILHQQLQQQQAQLEARLDRVSGSARPGAKGTDGPGLSQALGVLERLKRPWPELFDQLESARAPQVHLVQLGVDAGFQTVQMQAEAPTLEQVLQYSRELPGRGPLRAVRLTHHEWRTAPVGRIVVANLTAELATAPPARGAP